ncbi:MAG: hypothetical protein AAFY88_08440 [Acidobacteriota bacterium]
MKKILIISALAAVAAIPPAAPALAEADVTLSFKKGQAIDLLFVQQNPESGELLKAYFADVFPAAKAAGYTPMPGFAISQSPTRGNYHPSTAIFAGWPSPEAREGAMEAIAASVDDLQQRRLAIWPSFAMTVYTMAEDVTVAMDAKKTYVLTAYWGTKNGDLSTYAQSWKRRAAGAGGQVVLELEDGWSPFGYRYDPDYLAITEWKDAASFKAFHAGLTFDTAAVAHVDEFVLDVKAKKK